MRQRHAVKKSNHERWLITYSDMITLLLVFFIIMYTISRVDIMKFQYLSASLSKALGAGGSVLDSPGPSMVPGLSGQVPEVAMQSGESTQLEHVKQALQSYIKEANLAASVFVSLEERGLVLSFQEEVLFKLGSAELTPRAREIIRKVGPILVNVPNYLRVEGHTDNLPINTYQYPSNWELSSARAINVLQELIKNFQIQPQRLSASAYGEYRPRVPNDSDGNRQMNRRVNIVILRSKFGSSEPGSVAAGESYTE